MSYTPEEFAFTLHKAVKKSGLTLAQIAERLEQECGVQLTVSGLNHVINRGTIRSQRALQILAVCGVMEIKIRKPDFPAEDGYLITKSHHASRLSRVN